MKKLLLAILALISLTVSAQRKEVGSITWSGQVSAGYINAQNFLDDYKEWTGVSVGVKAKYQLVEDFGFSAGVQWLYSQSPENSLETAGVKTVSEFKATYIEVPVLASYDINEHLGLQFGLKPAFQTSFKAHAEASASGRTEKKDESVEGLNSFQLYVPVGLTYQFGGNFSLGLHYNFPVTKLNKEKADKDVKFHQFMLTAAYDF